jgi:hypothetical protein
MSLFRCLTRHSLFLGAFFLASQAMANQSMSDDLVRAELVGTWLPLNPANAAIALTDVRADGTEVSYIYADKPCGKVIFSTSIKWKIQDGVITHTINPGSVGARRTWKTKLTQIDSNNFSVIDLRRGGKFEYRRVNSCVSGK